MATIVYGVQLTANCTKNSTCPSAKYEVADQSLKEVLREQVRFINSHAFCINCGTPNRFIANLLPKKV